MDFERMHGDPCLFVLTSTEGRVKHITLLGVFVDDLAIRGTSASSIASVKQKMSSRFKTKDLGEADWLLGMKIKQTIDEITLDQSQYIRDVLKRFEEYLQDIRGRDPQQPLPTIPI